MFAVSLKYEFYTGKIKPFVNVARGQEEVVAKDEFLSYDGLMMHFNVSEIDPWTDLEACKISGKSHIGCQF